MTDYERGVEQVSAIYKEVIRGYVEKNKKLRDYAYALEECNDSAHYCEFCPHFHYDYEYDPHCDFDFDVLRAAAGMEVDE